MKTLWTKIAQDHPQRARAGLLQLRTHSIPTPAFMPVGTQATVKTLTPQELKDIGYRLILGNTYHLNLRPGIELIRNMGGLGPFMNWDGALLTDSGGFQVFSLAPLRKITAEGVRFQSHIDGSTHVLTPENVVDKQRDMRVDIAMVLDECPPYPCERSYVAKSMRLTIDWAARSLRHHRNQEKSHTHLFAIVQGGMHEDLRRQCAQELVALDFDGYAMGGLSVGEDKAQMYGMMDLVSEILPDHKPRYVMGVGTPEDILHGINAGVDMFDCVLPTRNARNGTLFTWQGKVSIKTQRWAEEKGPVDPTCPCYMCRNFSAAYVRHLYRSSEILALRLNTIHNLTFFHQLVSKARQSIIEKKWESFFKEVICNFN